MNKAKILTRSTEGAAAQLKSEGRAMSMLLKRYPPMAAFDDIRDPTTLRAVDQETFESVLVRDTV